jgi:hypothetical protein
MTIKTKEDQQEYTIVITQEGVTIKPSKSKCIPVALFDLVMDHKKRRFYYFFRERSTVFTCIEGCTDKQ